MRRLSATEGLHRPSPSPQRSSSISVDRASLSVGSLPFPPAVSPDPAYIAPSSASQIVTGDYDPLLDEDEEGEIGGMGATNVRVAPNALSMVNAFLDQLLYSFLASSRSTSIVALRLAVTEVLKPRLAKDAIASADTELQEFLGGEDFDELSIFQPGTETRGDWDLNAIWRRTRLRCMVYTRLGDLEEEDEEMWIEREDIGYKADGRDRLSRDLGPVLPTSAIFLTSVLEFIGEEVLRLSGKAAYTRFEARRRQERHSWANALGSERLSVEVVDIEKLAVNTTFGRLWRSWKKKVRSPSTASQRPGSRERLLRPASSLSSSEPRSRKASIGESGAHAPDASFPRRPFTAEDRERTSEAAAVPLPPTRDGASEAEGPGGSILAFGPDRKDRPHSMVMASNPSQYTRQMNGNRTTNDMSGRPELLQHRRSSSLPHLASRQHPFAQTSFLFNAREGPSQQAPGGHVRNESDGAAVTSMYDGVIESEADFKGIDKDEAAGRFSIAQEQEMRYLDDGLSSLAEASVGHPNPKEQAFATTATSDVYDIGPRSLVRENGTVQDSSIPDNNTTMQGFFDENATLDNRETSDGKSGIYGQDFSKDVSISYSGLEDPISYHNHDPADGATTAAGTFGTQPNGPIPTSAAGAVENASSAAPTSSPTFAQAQVPRKVSDIRKQLPAVSTGVERAGVQRMSVSAGSVIESPIWRTSTSSSRDIGALHSWGSSASQKAGKLNGLVARDSVDTGKQFAASRTSSEGSGSIAVRTPRLDEAQNSFEQLIQSDETIQYTLTPRSVREMDPPDSPRYSHSRTGTAELADVIRTSGPPPVESKRRSTSRSIVSLKSLDGLRSNPAAKTKPEPSPTSAPILEKPEMQTQRSRPTTAKTPGAPRDAYLNAETTRDFADFIRSTGPEEKSGISQRDGATSPPASPASKMKPNRAMTLGQRSMSGTSTGKKITKPNPGLSKSPPLVAPTPPSKRSVSKLQAREATYGPTRNEDLLEFLKQGPVDDRDNERRPIPGPAASVVPRNPYVASNLRTRISENTRSSGASTQDSSFANQSIRSTDSRTGLLDSPRAQPSRSPPHIQRQVPSSGEPSEPARKQRRVRDPYAIDIDSDDDKDDYYPGTPKPRPQQESLLDFLQSTAAPATNPRIPSAFDDMPIQSLGTDRRNGNTEKGAYQPTGATPGIRSAAPFKNPQPPPPSGPRGRHTNLHETSSPSHLPPQLPPLNALDISPHFTSTHALSSSSPANGLTAATTNNTNPKQQQQRQRPIKPAGVARAEREPPRGMNDLADFLRNSEPPTAMPEEFRGGNNKVAGEEREPEKGPGGGGVWGRLKGRRKSGR
ncbi:MAG: hypothetical protein Q9210_005840 [Variospora velana]